MKFSLFLVSMLNLLLCLPMARARDDQTTVGLIAISPQHETFAAKALQDCEPQGGKAVGEINKNGVYTLTGDLFHNGRIFTILDAADVVIVCEWKKPAWKAVSVINVSTEWNFPNGYREREGRSPDNQKEPFWMIELQNRPLLVIASDVEKAGQNYYVILFNPSCDQIMSLDSSFGSRPEVKDQYLLTGDASRNKAEYEVTDFSKIQNDKFVELKSWDDSQPWHAGDTENMPDDSSNYTTSEGKGYLILPDNRDDKHHPADYLIYRCDPNDKSPRPDSSTNRKETPFAAIYFTPDKNQTGGDTSVYLFQKLTGLPKELFPGYENWESKGKPAPAWKIKVTGTDQTLIKLLAPVVEHKSKVD